MKIFEFVHSSLAIITVCIFIVFGFTRFRSSGTAIAVQQAPLVTVFLFAFGFLVYCRFESREANFWFNLYAVLTLIASLSLFFSSLRYSRGVELSKAFDLISAKRIVTNGPFSVVRHPFYVSYLAAYSSIFFDRFSIVSVLLGLFLALFYLIAARNEEAAFLKSPDLRTAYERYVFRTGRFFPRITRRRYQPTAAVDSKSE